VNPGVVSVVCTIWQAPLDSRPRRSSRAARVIARFSVPKACRVAMSGRFRPVFSAYHCIIAGADGVA
jgi:hypothetical protein